MRISGNGQVTVTTPKFTPQSTVERFVNDHQDWIADQLRKQASRPSLDNESEVVIFGKKYQKTIKYSSEAPFGIRIVGDAIILNPADSKTEDWGLKEVRQMQKFLKNTAERYIVPRTGQLGSNMKIDYNAITLREQKTRWGSCSSKGNLNFNWRLVHYRPEIIDYVIIHELAHRTHMNHSKTFWQLVEKYDPEYRKHRGFLKRNGMAVG